MQNTQNQYKPTHYGLETEMFHAAQYVVNKDKVVIAYKMDCDDCWKVICDGYHGWFPDVDTLHKVIYA